MPMYEYECPACGWEGTHVATYENRDAQVCDCGEVLSRIEISAPGLVQIDGAYQCAAITSKGEKVPGHFHRDARRRKRP